MADKDLERRGAGAGRTIEQTAAIRGKRGRSPRPVSLSVRAYWVPAQKL